MAAFDGSPRGDTVARMLEGLRGLHRDDTRIASLGPAAFGFRGQGEPNLAAAHGVLAVVDGVFYNRGELPAGDCDAERLAALHDRHGFAVALERINGDFAAALFDPAAEVLYVGRDRFGVKPLYYLARSGRFLFASQPRGLLALAEVARTPNRRFVACFAGSHYRTFDNEPRESPYAAIAQLPAGGFLRVTPGGVQESSWWSLHEEPDLDEPEPALAERYRELLMDAVNIRLASARRPTFTLSGGMDSSSVLACAVQGSGRKQHAWSTVYDDATYDESAEISSILDETTEAWHPVRVGTPDLPQVIARMIEANGEPIATATWLSHYLLCEKVAEAGFGSLFGGLGGDELNAGEYEYFYFFFADLAAAKNERLLEHETARWIAHHDHPIFRKSFEAMREGLAQRVDLSQPGLCLPDRKRLARYRDVVLPEYFDLGSFVPVMDRPFSSYLKNRAHQDIFRETAPCCLRAADRQASAHGLDVVWPFFDHRLVELMFRVPGTMKIRAGVTKHLLREAMRGVLPEETRTRVKKTGWNAPAHVWFAGPGRALVRDLIGSRSFAERGLWNVTRVERIVDEHEEIVKSGRAQENHMMFLWQLVNLELWLR